MVIFDSYVSLPEGTKWYQDMVLSYEKKITKMIINMIINEFQWQIVLCVHLTKLMINEYQWENACLFAMSSGKKNMIDQVVQFGVLENLELT